MQDKEIENFFITFLPLKLKNKERDIKDAREWAEKVLQARKFLVSFNSRALFRVYHNNRFPND